MKMWSRWWIPSISLTWKVSSQSLVPYTPLRIVLSAATCIIEEGIRFKFDAWINQQHRRGKHTLYSRVKFTFRKVIQWGKRRKKNGTVPADEGDDVFPYDAEMNDIQRAKRRLRIARAAYESAATELKAAEKGMQYAR